MLLLLWMLTKFIMEAVKDTIENQINNHPMLLFVDSHNIAPTEFNNFNIVVDIPHQKLNNRFISESYFVHSGQQIGEVIITLPNFNTATSQDYIIDNYDHPEMCSITPETTFTYAPDGSAWTKSKYNNFGIEQTKAYSDYIHGIAKTNDILIDNTNPNNTQTGTWGSTTQLVNMKSSFFIVVIIYMLLMRRFKLLQQLLQINIMLI